VSLITFVTRAAQRSHWQRGYLLFCGWRLSVCLTATLSGTDGRTDGAVRACLLVCVPCRHPSGALINLPIGARPLESRSRFRRVLGLRPPGRSNGSNRSGMSPRSPELATAAQSLREESPEWRRQPPPSESPPSTVFASNTNASSPRLKVPTLPLPERFQKASPTKRAATLPPNDVRWEGRGRAPTSRLRRASNALCSRRDLLQERAASSGIRPALLWALLLLLLLWCVGTTVLLVRLARNVNRVEQSFELIGGPAKDEGVRKLLDKFNAGSQAVKRRVGKVPLVSAAYIVLAPHVGWVYTLVAPHLGPLRFIGTRVFAACKLIMPTLLRLKPLLERVKPLLLLVEIRAKARMLFTEWAAKGQTAV
jgi:hypothetical protein